VPMPKTGSVATWRRAQMALLFPQGMDAAAIANVLFTSEDRVRDVIRNFNANGVRVAVSEVQGRGVAEVHVAAAAGD
jgi:hypothetical protein